MEGRKEEEPSSLAASLDRLSLATNNAPNPENAPRAPPPQSPSGQPLRKTPSTPALNTRSPVSSRKLSTARSQGQQYSGSPVSSRQPSENFSNTTPTKPLFRRASSMNLSSKSPMSSGDSPLPAPSIETPEVTASSVAAQHFRKELARHSSPHTQSTETIVIIHDACYGHRFSRPKTSKASLSLIVERPERIQACATGVAAAYVRLGGRHAGADNAITASGDMGSDLPFKILRSSRFAPLNGPAVTSVHGVKWMQELTVMCNAASDKLAARGKELERPSTPGASTSKPKLHEGDLYLCKESLQAFQGALGGVMDAVDAVFGKTLMSSDGTPLTKRAFVAIRPPGHHCSADMPSGFCWLNNVHVGIEHAAQIYGLTHAAIIDFDLHHGDGSQSITWEQNAKASKLPKNTPQSRKTSIGYFSLHDINSYPCEYGDQEKVQNASLCIENAHNQTIWNVHLQPWKTEADFWELYKTRYSILLEKMRAYLQTQTRRIATSPNVSPKAAIFISAGFDASEWEGEGMQRHKVNVPTEFYARFTQDVIRIAAEEGTGVDGRVISVLEGGYSDRALTSGVFSHLSGLAGIPQKTAPALRNSIIDCRFLSGLDCYDAAWWDASMLNELEAIRNPAEIVQPKKTRPGELSTYASPTQSFSAKAVDPSKVHRSISGLGMTMETASPTTLTFPEIGWAVASYELSKLLIPSDRQVNSCRHEELSEPRLKARHSAIGLSTESTVIEKRELRGRKAKVPVYPDTTLSNGVEIPMRKKSDSKRRQTISELPLTADRADSEDLTRPSTLDSKAASDGTDVPKTQRARRASGTKADLATNSSASKAPAVPKIPTKFAARPKAEKAANTSGALGPSDVDNLVTGVRKITLKMPSKEPSPTAPGSPAKSPRKSAKSGPAKPPAPKVLKANTTNAALSNSIKSEPFAPDSKPAPFVAGQMAEPRPAEQAEVAGGAGAGADAHGTPVQAVPPPISDKSSAPPQNFVAYDPSTHYANNEQTRQGERPEALTWLPPNTNTPVASPMKRGKEAMPIFTSSGMIPFAQGHQSALGEERQGSGPTHDASAPGQVWEVLPPPQK